MSAFEDSISQSLNDLRRRVADLETLDRPLTSTFTLKTTTVSAGVGLTGGGDLSANRTIAMGTPSAVGVGTSNQATGVTHTHSVTSSNTGAVSTLMSTDASGEVLVRGKSGSVLRAGSTIEAGVTFGAVTLPATATLSFPGWTEVLDASMSNGWVWFGVAPWPRLGYYRDQSGIVHLRGLVKNGTINADIYALPSGFRPANQTMFVVHSSSGAIRLDIAQTGAIRTVGAPAAVYSYLSLDNIHFQIQ